MKFSPSKMIAVVSVALVAMLFAHQAGAQVFITGTLTTTGQTSTPRIKMLPGGTDYLSIYAYGGGNNNAALVENDDGNNPAIVGAARTKNTTGGSAAPGGFFGFCFNDNAVTIASCWGGYVEARRYHMPGVPGLTNGFETEITEFNTVPQPDPYNYLYGVGNYSVGLNIGSGGGCATGTPCYNPNGGTANAVATSASAALNIHNNAGDFLEGITFGYNAIHGNDGMTDGQSGIAVNMPRNDQIVWDYCSNTTNYPTNCAANTHGATITSNVKSANSVQSLTFDNAAGTILNSKLGLQVSSNANGLLPSTTCAATGFILTDNYGNGTGGPAEGDFINCFAGGAGFSFYQMTGAGAGNHLADINGGGVVVGYGGLQAKPRTYSETGGDASCSASAKGTIVFITNGPSAPAWHQTVTNATLGSANTGMFLGCNGTNWTVMDY